MAIVALKELSDPTMIQVVLISLFTIFLIVKFWKNSGKNLPPGPPKLPFIGNMNRLLGLAPHRSLTELAQKYGPIMHLQLGSVSAIIISSADVAKEIMKTQDLVFANRPQVVSAKLLGYNYTDVAFAPYGTYWRQLRKICIVELLNMNRVNSYRFVREEEVSLLVKTIASSCGAPVNIADELFTLNHDITTRITFGKKSDDRFRFKAAMREGTSLSAGFHIGDFFPSLEFVGALSGMKARIENNFVELDGILSQVIDEHLDETKNKKKTEDLIDVLLRVKKNGELEIPLTHDNIKAVILDLFVGGTENSSNTVEWIMSELVKNPTMMEKAQAEVRRVVGEKPTVEESDLGELSYMKLVIKESLRLHTPLPLLIPRETMEPCTINGYKIPAKTRAIVNYYAIGRDPFSWTNPDSFDPERFSDSSVDFRGRDYELIPFGAGRRICPGISFAIANIELTLASLLFHFDWKLPGEMKPEDLDMDETFGLTIFKKENLHLVPTVRYPLNLSD
ncbi:hypothetical protein GIB67_013400 [Kingdonia uniflora]|uniref:Cytochrome P450 n=1 Tax=Kingdonia uniflora TaxID=39325 RepID=A0A7J7LR51_9MAGN|nr:hypothetical protein GIB67_013400 [Kingdonia uniflora]